MVSISQAVSELIEKHEYLETALAKGIINYGKLASELFHELKNDPRLKNTTIKETAIMMALRRFAKELKNTETKMKLIFKENYSLQLFNTMYGLFEITVERNSLTSEVISSLYNIVKIDRGDFLTITQGIFETTIISNFGYREQIKEVFDKSKILNINSELASISLRIPEESVETPGLFYLVTKQLHWDNINIIEIVSTFTEMTFILKEIDIPSAMNSLQKLSGSHYNNTSK